MKKQNDTITLYAVEDKRNPGSYAFFDGYAFTGDNYTTDLKKAYLSFDRSDAESECTESWDRVATLKFKLAKGKK